MQNQASGCTTITLLLKETRSNKGFSKGKVIVDKRTEVQKNRNNIK